MNNPRDELLKSKPRRENFSNQEDFEEALGWWNAHQGRILALTQGRQVPSATEAPNAPLSAEAPDPMQRAGDEIETWLERTFSKKQQ